MPDDRGGGSFGSDDTDVSDGGSDGDFGGGGGDF
jgi:hypothetical protein